MKIKQWLCWLLNFGHRYYSEVTFCEYFNTITKESFGYVESKKCICGKEIVYPSPFIEEV